LKGGYARLRGLWTGVHALKTRYAPAKRPWESGADYRGKALRCKRRRQLISPHRPGGRTQRIEACLLFIAQRIVEFRERGLHGLHCAKRGVESLLHCLDTTRGGQHLVGRATDLEAFRRLDGGILQVVERGPLRRHGLDRLADALDRQVGDAGRLLVAKVREIALVLAGGVGIRRRRDGVEACLLLVAERSVEALKRWTHGLHGGKHHLQPVL